MKSDQPRITLLGSNSGRNLGDAAILSSILNTLSAEIPGAEFYVPTTHPRFTRENYGSRYNVKAVNVMPWTGSIRLLGLPTLYCLARSDAALICDGIIFGKNLLNPLFNFLITLIFLVPWARLFGCKLICYNCGIGPFPGKLSRWCARYVMNSCDLIMLREQDSIDLAKELGVTQEIHLTGDAAFLNEVSDDTRAVEVARELQVDLTQPLLGINVTRYIDSWLAESERVASRDQCIDALAAGITAFRLQQLDCQLLVISTQPMDEAFCEKFANRIGAALLENSSYLSHDIQAVMRHCDLLLGMRFHSLVLASAVECPVIGLVYAPKVRGYMRLLECSEYGLELASLSSQKLKTVLLRAWEGRRMLQSTQRKHVDKLKIGAQQAAVLLRTSCFPEIEVNN